MQFYSQCIHQQSSTGQHQQMTYGCIDHCSWSFNTDHVFTKCPLLDIRIVLEECWDGWKRLSLEAVEDYTSLTRLGLGLTRLLKELGDPEKVDLREQDIATVPSICQFANVMDFHGNFTSFQPLYCKPQNDTNQKNVSSGLHKLNGLSQLTFLELG